MTRRSRWIIGTILALVVGVVALGSLRHSNPQPRFDAAGGDPARTWPYPIDARERCWLRVQRNDRNVIRANCFAINGTLYTHSNRFAQGP